MRKPVNSTPAIVKDGKCAVKSLECVKVIIRIPNDMTEVSKRRKINQIYDILKPIVPH